MRMNLMKLSKQNAQWEMHVARKVVKKGPQEAAVRVIKNKKQNRNSFYHQEGVASEQFYISDL